MLNSLDNFHKWDLTLTLDTKMEPAPPDTTSFSTALKIVGLYKKESG